MGDKAKRYFKKEFRLSMFALEHEDVADFYISSWQRNRSSLPLLMLRGLIFVGCVAILVSSIVLTVKSMSIGHWFIFMTHWGLILITVTSGLALAVSIVAFINGPIDASFGLPWYVKLYWIVYNITVATAFFITIFYWAFLTEEAQEYAIDPVLDVFIHAINSVLMLALVMTSRHPTRMLHFYFPLCFSVVYMVFSIIFHFAGGLSPFGTSWIYPMLDWSKPGETVGVVIASAIAIILSHWLVVAISVSRDTITKRYRNTTVLSISDDRYN